LTQAGRGLDAINEEIEQHGTAEEKECRDYVLYEEAGSSEKTFQNGWKRDCDPVTGKVLDSRQVDDAQAQGGKRGMRFSDFMAHAVALFCRLTEAEVFALRYYTTAGFKGINWPLRDRERRDKRQPHKLSVLVFTLAGAIKKLRAWAGNASDAHAPDGKRWHAILRLHGARCGAILQIDAGRSLFTWILQHRRLQGHQLAPARS